MRGLIIKKGLLSLTFFYPEDVQCNENMMFTSSIRTGFPSYGDDYVDQKLDLNRFLIRHPSATFYVRVKGNSMENTGIRDGDMLIVDRAINPRNNDIAVCVINGEYTVKRLKKENGALYLMPENTSYKPIRVLEGADFQVWGIVAYVIHKAE